MDHRNFSMRRQLILIRHGKTEGNIKRKYIGRRIDEPLMPIEKQALEDLRIAFKKREGFNWGRAVYVSSPMKRCKETLEALFKGVSYRECQGLLEMDFGDFEGKSYEDLKDNEVYKAWLLSGGEKAFPNGESREEFAERTFKSFKQILKETDENNLVVNNFAFANNPPQAASAHVENFIIMSPEEVWSK